MLGIAVAGINFVCFCLKTDAIGHDKDVQSIAEDAVIERIQPEHGSPTLDTFRVRHEGGGVWKVTGKWRVDSRERHDSTEFVCMAHGDYSVTIKYEGREKRYYDHNFPVYEIKNTNVICNYMRGSQ